MNAAYTIRLQVPGTLREFLVYLGPNQADKRYRAPQSAYMSIKWNCIERFSLFPLFFFPSPFFYNFNVSHV